MTSDEVAHIEPSYLSPHCLSSTPEFLIQWDFNGWNTDDLAVSNLFVCPLEKSLIAADLG